MEKNKKTIFLDFFLLNFFVGYLQEDFAELEEVNIGGGPVTSQPTAGKAHGASMPVFAMPAPPNPTNPFTGGGANESTSLNMTDQTTYTPGQNIFLIFFLLKENFNFKFKYNKKKVNKMEIS